ncbi:TnsD family Tn7-like transposition protein [Vibrio breoganii]|uniref:TnsD family Tn7-like transposition protein n=1 Tax=Vibrio breoganii TaxID=553239 RepID=UPI000C837989|nr:TnsD family Tn7-like transposition protein [Vibrio breoganii]PMG94088.1 hypothetical protein BCU79_12710 [Vibrio breoganii]
MFFARALEDELLFGRIIRQLTLSGEEPTHFAEKVLISSRHTFHPTLTVGLSKLSRLMGDSAETLLYEQTIIPMLLFFLPQHSEKLQKLFLGNNGNKALWESQFSSFAQGNSCCLKWCPDCLAEDVSRVGVAYWHRSHQVFGVSACYKHRKKLQIVELSSRQRLARSLLPSNYKNPEGSVTDVESKVAIYASGLLKVISAKADPFNWAKAYRNKLNDLGYLTQGNQIRRQALFKDFFESVSSYPRYDDCPLPKHSQDYRYLSELLLPMSSHHPFRHLLFGSWLFERAEELFEYEMTKKTCHTPVASNNTNDIEAQCLNLLRQGISMAQVYRVTGKSRCYLKRIAMEHSVHLNLKPRKLTDVVRVKILRLAKLCMHRKKIAEICNIGIGSVEQVISSSMGLVAWRKQCHFESKRRQCRAILKRFMLNNPTMIRQDIKRDCNKVFFWLYLNDRPWLESSLPPPTERLGYGKYKVR